MTTLTPDGLLLPWFIMLFFNSQAVHAKNTVELVDFIVVGGGSAGSVLANRLTENPRTQVLLLEAGREQPIISRIPLLAPVLPLTDVDWGFYTEPQDNACFGNWERKCPYPQGKVLGGGSSINYMIYVRGNRRDYDLWESMGNYNWSFNDVLPYFKKSEHNVYPSTQGDEEYHGYSGPLTVSRSSWKSQLLETFLRSGQELGYPVRDINGATQTGFMPTPVTIRKGVRCSANKAYLTDASHRSNLRISLRSYVTKILIDENKKAYGVTYVRNSKEYMVLAKKEVVLSAGAVNTPKLLMLSGIGDPEELTKHGVPVVHPLRGVGQNLHDHPSTVVPVFTVNLKSTLKAVREAVSPIVLLKYLFGSGTLSSNSLLEAVAFLRTPLTDQTDDWPDIQIHFLSYTFAFDGGIISRYIFKTDDETFNNFLKPLRGTHGFTFMTTLLRPKSRGEVKLRSSDPHDPPLIDPKFFTHPEDIRVAVEGVKLAFALGNSSSFRTHGAKLNQHVLPQCREFEPHVDQYLACAIRHVMFTTFHPVGTAKMGPASDPMAVVDPELRLYGVKNLRVIDSSIFPVIVSGNTNAPVIMVAEKAADIIKRHWKLKTVARNHHL